MIARGWCQIKRGVISPVNGPPATLCRCSYYLPRQPGKVPLLHNQNLSASQPKLIDSRRPSAFPWRAQRGLSNWPPVFAPGNAQSRPVLTSVAGHTIDWLRQLLLRLCSLPVSTEIPPHALPAVGACMRLA